MSGQKHSFQEKDFLLHILEAISRIRRLYGKPNV